MILDRGSDWLVAEWRDHLLGYWTGAVNHHGMRATSLHLTAYSQKHPSRRCAYVCTLLDGFHLPDSESRSEMARIAPKLGGRLHGFGVIVPGKGFKNAAIRGFVTGMAQLTRAEFPLPTFENITLAHAWFASRADNWGTLDDLIAADAQFRGHLHCA